MVKITQQKDSSGVKIKLSFYLYHSDIESAQAHVLSTLERSLDEDKAIEYVITGLKAIAKELEEDLGSTMTDGWLVDMTDYGIEDYSENI